MGLVHIMERGGDDYRKYKMAVKEAKRAIKVISELTEDMEEEFGQRGGYGQREGYGQRGGYGRRNYGERYDGREGNYQIRGSYGGRENMEDMDDMDEMEERRGRDSMGRYTSR